MTKWKQGSPLSPDQQLNPITSHPQGHFLNIEALFRCMDCSPCLPISISFPPAERLNLIRTHWCVDNEGVTRSWERPSNSPSPGEWGFWVGFGWVALLRDACTHVSLWQPLPKSKARHRRCMYYIEIQYRTQIQTFLVLQKCFFSQTNGAHVVYISTCVALSFCIDETRL